MKKRRRNLTSHAKSSTISRVYRCCCNFFRLFRNVSLSKGKSTTRFGVLPFFRIKVTFVIGRETKAHEDQRKKKFDFFFAEDMKTDGLNPSPKRLQHSATPSWGHPQTVPRGEASPHPCDTKKRFAEAPPGRREGDSARDGQHSRPSSFPHEGHRELHVPWCISRFGVCQHLQGLHGLHLPPVSTASTTSLHRPEEVSSGYVTSLSWRACNRTAPS